MEGFLFSRDGIHLPHLPHLVFRGFMSTTSVRIKDNVYSRLELNAEGYESVSDTIGRANLSLEKDKALDMLDRQVALSVTDLTTEGITKEKAIPMHYSRDAIQSAMDLVLRLYPNYKIDYEIKTNMCCINVMNKDVGL